MDHIKFYQPGSQPCKPPSATRFIPYTGNKASSSLKPISKTPKRKGERSRLTAQTAGLITRACQEKDPLLKPPNTQTQETSMDDPQSFTQSFTPEEGTQNGDHKDMACDDDPLHSLFYDNDEPDMRAITTSVGAAQNGIIRETLPHESKGAQQNGGSPLNEGCGDKDCSQADEIPETQFPHTDNSEDQPITVNDDDQILHLTRVTSTMLLSSLPAQPATGGLESDLGSGILCIQPSHPGADSSSSDMLRTQVEPGDTPDIPILITDDDLRLGDDRTIARADLSQPDTTSERIGGLSGDWEQSEVISDCVVKEELNPGNNTVPSPRASKHKHAHLSSQGDSQYDYIEFVDMTGATNNDDSQRASSKRPKLIRPQPLPPAESSLAEEPIRTESSASPDIKPRGFSRVYSYRRLTGYKTINGIPHVWVAWLQSMEPAELFPADEVEEMKQWCVLRSLERRGRPSQPQVKQAKRPGRPPKSK